MLSQWVIFVILAGSILILIGVIVFLERALTKKKVEGIKTPEYMFTQELAELKKMEASPQEMLGKIDELAKKVLSPNVGSDGYLDYSQLSEISSSKPHVAKFCSDMAKSLYAGESLTASGARGLLRNLEDMMKEEGKVIMVEQKHEQIESERLFLDRWIENASRRISAKAAEWKSKKEIAKEMEMPAEENAAAAAGTKGSEAPEAEASNPEEELKKITTKIIPTKKKAASRRSSSKERNEYKYIESLDVLDRIKDRLAAKKAE